MNNFIRQRKQYIIWSIIIVYALLGHVPFWYRVGVHFFTQGGLVWGDTLPIDFSWFAIHTFFWLHVLLLLLTSVAVQWYIRRDVWKRITIGVGVVIVSFIPLANSFMQSPVAKNVPGFYAPRLNVSVCPRLDIYMKDRLTRTSEPVYVSLPPGDSLQKVGEGYCARARCNMKLGEKHIEEVSDISTSELRQCIDQKHKVEERLRI